MEVQWGKTKGSRRSCIFEGELPLLTRYSGPGTGWGASRTLLHMNSPRDEAGDAGPGLGVACEVGKEKNRARDATSLSFC